jgi:nitrogenase molybdenum-iron protein alpha/beta subunit
MWRSSPPLGAGVEDLRRIPDADLNICLYPEVAESTCLWLERNFGMPFSLHGADRCRRHPRLPG